MPIDGNLCEHMWINKYGKGGNCKECSCFIYENFDEDGLFYRTVAIKGVETLQMHSCNVSPLEILMNFLKEEQWQPLLSLSLNESERLVRK
jgi:hypothetical protein